MPRNLKLVALHSFVAEADADGISRAAGGRNLTQSAISMKIRRLEQALDTALLDRSARKVSLTGAGEPLSGYVRRMLVLNDEVFGKLT